MASDASKNLKTLRLGSSLRLYRGDLLLSITLAALSFSYNVWRLEVSEHNATVRTAGIQILQEFAR